MPEAGHILLPAGGRAGRSLANPQCPRRHSATQNTTRAREHRARERIPPSDPPLSVLLRTSPHFSVLLSTSPYSSPLLSSAQYCRAISWRIPFFRSSAVQ